MISRYYWYIVKFPLISGVISLAHLCFSSRAVLAAAMADEVKNKQVILKDFVNGFPKVSDMYITTNSFRPKLPQSSNAVLVKNLYLSCDPYMRSLMRQGISATSYTPGAVITLDSPSSLCSDFHSCLDCDFLPFLRFEASFGTESPRFSIALVIILEFSASI